MAKSKDKHLNRLNSHQVVKVLKWYRKNKVWLHAGNEHERWRADNAARIAEKELETPVTGSNMTYIAKLADTEIWPFSSCFRTNEEVDEVVTRRRAAAFQERYGVPMPIPAAPAAPPVVVTPPAPEPNPADDEDDEEDEDDYADHADYDGYEWGELPAAETPPAAAPAEIGIPSCLPPKTVTQPDLFDALPVDRDRAVDNRFTVHESVINSLLDKVVQLERKQDSMMAVVNDLSDKLNRTQMDVRVLLEMVTKPTAETTT